jgi:hypothetical protein
MSEVGRACSFGRADVHVRISRIVIDRAVAPGVDDRWRDRLTDRIAAEIEAPMRAEAESSRPTLIDSIARAVSARVSPSPTQTGTKG